MIPCYTPECKKHDCIFCQSPKTNLCPAIRLVRPGVKELHAHPAPAGRNPGSLALVPSGLPIGFWSRPLLGRLRDSRYFFPAPQLALEDIPVVFKKLIWNCLTVLAFKFSNY